MNLSKAASRKQVKNWHIKSKRPTKSRSRMARMKSWWSNKRKDGLGHAETAADRYVRGGSRKRRRTKKRRTKKRKTKKSRRSKCR